MTVPYPHSLADDTYPYANPLKSFLTPHPLLSHTLSSIHSLSPHPLPSPLPHPLILSLFLSPPPLYQLQGLPDYARRSPHPAVLLRLVKV